MHACDSVFNIKFQTKLMDYVVYKARQGAYQRYVDEQKECVFEEVSLVGVSAETALTSEHYQYHSLTAEWAASPD